MRIQIGVIGASSLPKEKAKLAEELGREIAKNKVILMTGTAEGIPGLVAKSTKDAGGSTVGIVFKNFSEEELKPFDAVVFTGMSRGFDILIKTTDGIIAFGGGAGTLREIALAYKEKKPIVVLEGGGGWADKLADTPLKRGGPVIYSARTPKEAIIKLLRLISEKSAQQ